jgi:hypothetical protein
MAGLFEPLTKPTAAQLNALRDQVNTLYGQLGGEATPVNLCGPHHRSEAVFTLFHTRRYLVFGSQGQLIDPTGINEPISLSTEEAYGSRDLDEVAWLAYGMMYVVTGVSTALEDDAPVGVVYA